MTTIEWVKDKAGKQGKTWNPIVGCSKVSPGCANCYAETMAKRLKAMGRPEYQDTINGNGRWTGRVTLVPERLEQPLKRKKPTMYFVNSMSDLFHEDVPFETINSILNKVYRSPQHTFQVLTKRPERALEWFKWFFGGDEMEVFPSSGNLWLGVSIENQKTADARIPYLLRTPAAVRFVSAEPLLGPIDLDGYIGDLIQLSDYDNHVGDGIDWLIAGCESGPHRRPAELAWFRSLRDQCVVADVPFFLKQAEIDGKLEKMPELDGREWNQMPEVAK